MKRLLVSPVFVFLLTVFGPSMLSAADTPATAAGYWEGEISLPDGKGSLAIAVELSSGSASSWEGTIDIPMQGMRNFKLNPVTIEGAAVTLGMPGVPGDPRFNGKLATDAKTISGDFNQGGGSLPFRLERKDKPPTRPVIETTPERGVPGKGLAGKWRGSIKPIPATELRLGLELAPNAAGKQEGIVVSIDQGNARIPISGLTETEGKVHFDLPGVPGNAEFNGQLSADGSEIVGNWIQGGRSTPLVFKRLPTTAP